MIKTYTEATGFPIVDEIELDVSREQAEAICAILRINPSKVMEIDVRPGTARIKYLDAPQELG